MGSFAGKLAVVTGGGSGIGRELVRQLAAQGCSVAACDLNLDTVTETAALARAGAPPGTRVTSHACDVSDGAQVLRFRDELLKGHAGDHVDLVFSNAGIGGGSSFISDPREVWERVFAVDWWGIYHCARVFLPLLIASGDGILVNTSSVNGLWASLGPGMPSTAYATAKFAVRGFTEALIEDLRVHAPHVRAAVVMPGHVGTDIVANCLRILGLPDPERMSDAELEAVRPELTRRGMAAADAPARPRRRPSSSMGCDPVPGGSSWARMPRRSTRRCARSLRPPTTTPNCSARQHKSQRQDHLPGNSQGPISSSAGSPGKVSGK